VSGRSGFSFLFFGPELYRPITLEQTNQYNLIVRVGDEAHYRFVVATFIPPRNESRRCFEYLKKKKKYEDVLLCELVFNNPLMHV